MRKVGIREVIKGQVLKNVRRLKLDSLMKEKAMSCWIWSQMWEKRLISNV